MSDHAFPSRIKNGWRPIETAPDPDTCDKVLVWSEGYVLIADRPIRYDDGTRPWFDDEMNEIENVTHWQPLPGPPS